MKPQKIYVITGAGLTKIGIAKNPERRRRQLERCSASPLALAYTADVNNAREVEKAAHALLSAVRHHGEWFDVQLEEAIQAITAATDLVLDRPLPPPAPGRVTWIARISVRPADWEALKTMAKIERVSIATLIGWAIETYVTARST